MRTIRVTGKGLIKVKPDTTRITLSLERTYPEYEETLRRSSEDTESLRDLIAAFGLERSDLKTLNFDVEPEYESHKEKGVYKERFIGYKYRHRMKFEFASDNDRLGRILYALAHCPVKPDFRLSYTVKDPEAVKNELLGKAISDAREKANVLTKASGIILKDIQSIDYSWDEINFEVHPMRTMYFADVECPGAAPIAAKYDMDIEPDDIDVSDTVTVLWEIGG